MECCTQKTPECFVLAKTRARASRFVYHAGRLVGPHEHIASAFASLFAWILVDEFQDSSLRQILILREIHKFGHTRFFCVGDPNQSIY